MTLLTDPLHASHDKHVLLLSALTINILVFFFANNCIEHTATADAHFVLWSLVRSWFTVIYFILALVVVIGWVGTAKMSVSTRHLENLCEFFFSVATVRRPNIMTLTYHEQVHKSHT